MDLSLLLKGFAIGLTIAAPIGPIGVLCIRRTLADGRAAGLASGLGAATADAAYGAVAAFGLTSLSDLLVSHQLWLRVVGGVFLLYLGVKTFISQPREAAARPASGLLAAYASVFVLTLTNPVTIIYFAAVFAGLGIAPESGDMAAAWALVIGVFSGSAIWWVVLSSGIGFSRSRFSPKLLGMANRLAGAVIFGFGIAALAAAFRVGGG